MGRRFLGKRPDAKTSYVYYGCPVRYDISSYISLRIQMGIQWGKAEFLPFEADNDSFGFDWLDLPFVAIATVSK